MKVYFAFLVVICNELYALKDIKINKNPITSLFYHFDIFVVITSNCTPPIIMQTHINKL